MTEKPAAAAVAETSGESEFRVPAEPGVQPRGGIAKAFAHVFAPAAGATADIARGEPGFPALSRPAEFTAGVALELMFGKLLVGSAQSVGEAQPDEMEKLVDEDAAQLSGLRSQGLVEDDFALAQIRTRMDFLAARTGGHQAAPHGVRLSEKPHLDRRSSQLRQTCMAQNRFSDGLDPLPCGRGSDPVLSRDREGADTLDHAVRPYFLGAAAAGAEFAGGSAGRRNCSGTPSGLTS